MRKLSINQKNGNVEKMQKVKLSNNILEREEILGMEEVAGEDRKKDKSKRSNINIISSNNSGIDNFSRDINCNIVRR